LGPFAHAHALVVAKNESHWLAHFVAKPAVGHLGNVGFGTTAAPAQHKQFYQISRAA